MLGWVGLTWSHVKKLAGSLSSLCAPPLQLPWPLSRRRGSPGRRSKRATRTVFGQPVGERVPVQAAVG